MGMLPEQSYTAASIISKLSAMIGKNQFITLNKLFLINI